MSRYVDADVLRELLIKYVGLTNGFDRAFNEVPTIEPKRGEWIVVSDYGEWMRKCTECGWRQGITLPKMRGWHYNFCPNCGARMKGAGDD